MNPSSHLRIAQAAERLGVSTRTLRRWDTGGLLPSVRHPVNRYRLYDAAMIETTRRRLRAGGRLQPAKPTAPQPVGLPALPSPLVGRDDAIGDVRRLVTRRRLVTLFGPAGVGKTVIAIEAARRLPWPAAFADLSLCQSPEELTSIVAMACGIRAVDEVPTDRAVDLIAEALHGLGTQVLVLDNLEQLMGHIPLIIDRWLTEAPELRILGTSREALRQRGEYVVPITPLSVTSAEPEGISPAVALIIERVRARHASWSPTVDELAALDALARRLDGVPLALEITAEHVALEGASSALARADGSATWVADRPGAPTRHRSMVAALAELGRARTAIAARAGETGGDPGHIRRG